MSTKEQNREIMQLARRGKIDGDGGVRQKINEAVKLQLDLDYCEKPYFRSALWEATWKNNEAIVKLLADKGASVSFTDYQGRTPLHEAAYYGHLNLVEFFLDKGAPLDSVDVFGQTPLFRAVDGGRDEVVEFLIKRKAETNLLDTDDVTAQHLAAFQGMPQMSWWLLYKGAWRNRFSIDECTKARNTEPTSPRTAGAPESEFEEPESPLSPKGAAKHTFD